MNKFQVIGFSIETSNDQFGKLDSHGRKEEKEKEKERKKRRERSKKT